ncbi:MAG TPA: hypothetical protein DHV05_06080 [Acholeplasmataceae bacterium]|nr:hypothetical protein [Acholeplasmataceae bacterium]
MSLLELRSYVTDIKKDDKNSHGYRAASSFSILEHIDLMMNRYLKEEQTEKGAILLDVFGMLQGLFVGIDALYDLAIGLTQYKYHINVNANPTLHELKYIRNDIVGHPTHRTYPNGGMGFSILSTEHLSKEKFSYHTYVFEKNHLEVKTKDVYLKPLLDAYQNEKKHILDEILIFLKHETTKTDIPEALYTLFETLNLETLTDIKTMFMKEYQVPTDSPHRFIWRLGLLEEVITWVETDVELNDFVSHIGKTQVSKLYEIALDLENRKGKDLYAPIPNILKGFYKFIRAHESYALHLLKNLHDKEHPLHDADLIALMSLNPNKEASKLLRFLKDQKDEHKVFMIGSILRGYRPKSK